MQDIKYPIGTYDLKTIPTEAQVMTWLDELERFPGELRTCVAGLIDEQLDTPYRRAGWTIRQIVHHLADSHINAYVRLKLALTENSPQTIAYAQDAWAQLPDSQLPLAPSIIILENLHLRLITLLRNVEASELQRQFLHPELGSIRVDSTIGLYAWHGKHHCAHIAGLRKREMW